MLFEFFFSVVFAAYSVVLLLALCTFGCRYPTKVFWGLSVLLSAMALSCSSLALLRDITVLLAFITVGTVFYRRTSTPVPKPHEEDPYGLRFETTTAEGIRILIFSSGAVVLAYVVLPLLVWSLGKNL